MVQIRIDVLSKIYLGYTMGHFQNAVLHSTKFLVRCGHVLSAILKTIFIYLLNCHISLWAFALRKWNIKSAREMLWASLLYPVNFFLKRMSRYYLRRFSHIAERLPQHCEYRNTLSKLINVAIMLCRCFLTTFAATLWQLFLNFPGICCRNLIFAMFSQVSHNVVETLLQPYIVSWDNQCDDISFRLHCIFSNIQMHRSIKGISVYETKICDFGSYY